MLTLTRPHRSLPAGILHFRITQLTIHPTSPAISFTTTQVSPEGCRKGAGRGGVKTLDETTVRGQRRRRGARMKAEKGGVEKGKRKVKGQHVAGQRVSVCPSVFAYGEGAQTADVTEVISLSSPSSFSSPFIPLFFPFLLFSLSLPPFRSPCFPSSVSPRRSPICR